VGTRREKKESRAKAELSHDNEFPEKAIIVILTIGESIKSTYYSAKVSTSRDRNSPPAVCGMLPFERETSVDGDLQFQPRHFCFIGKTHSTYLLHLLPAYCATENDSPYPLRPIRSLTIRHHGLGRRCSRHAGFACGRATQAP
jgi:hypothetical protein